MAPNPIIRVWNWLGQIDEIVGRWQILAWIVAAVAFIVAVPTDEAILITVGIVSLVVALLLLFSGESRKKAEAATESQGLERKSPPSILAESPRAASQARQSSQGNLTTLPAEPPKTSVRPARAGWTASVDPLSVNDPYAPGLQLSLDGSASPEAFSVYGCEVRGSQGTYAYAPGDFLLNLEPRKEEAIRFPGEFHPKPGWPPPPGRYVATWTAEDSRLMEVTGPLHLAGLEFELEDSGELLTPPIAQDPASASAVLAVDCDNGSDFHAEDVARLGPDEESEHLSRFTEKGLNVPEGAMWTRYTYLVRVTNVSGYEAKRVRVLLVDIEPRPRHVALPKRLQWNGMDSHEIDLHPGLSAYAELYSRFGLGGYWLRKPEYDWGDVATVTVEAWGEGTKPTRATFAFAGLQGPYIYPSVLTIES